MDPLSLTVGFVVGSFTGAAGHYFGEKYTDKRRNKEIAAQKAEEWLALESRFPKLIAHVRERVTGQARQFVRHLVILAACRT